MSSESPIWMEFPQAFRLEAAALRWRLQESPQVWNQHRTRTQDPESPHHEVDDVWVRWAPPGTPGDKPHESVWYPVAQQLPEVGEIVFPLMALTRSTQLGGVLITRIRAGKRCKPHTDPGWHARHYQKFAVQIESHPGQAFCFDNARMVARPGDVYGFDNSQRHWVENDTECDRITMIVCLRK